MFGLPFGVVVETLVAVLLATTIGYCITLNQRLKRLHADRDQLRKMVSDLVSATTLANAAIQELKATAQDAETVLEMRLGAAEKFGIELANHVNAGQQILDKISRITTAARNGVPVVDDHMPEPTRLQSALAQLAQRQRIRGDAA